MILLLDGLSWLLIVAGSVFLIIGGVGLLRFPDFYSRVQAAGLTDTLCSICILLGLMLQADTLPVAAKLFFTLVFLALTGPTATHALVKSAHVRKLRHWQPAERKSQ